MSAVVSSKPREKPSPAMEASSTMFDPTNASQLQIDSDGSVFIDRSPDLFAPILDFLRTGRLEVPAGINVNILDDEMEHYDLYYEVYDK
ncbi:hypothetical protein HK097_011485, partial [Rhizophlyctis rosea]